MAYSGFPRIVNPDFSPPEDIMSYQDPFDKNYLAEAYNTNPDYSLSTFFDTEAFFDQPTTSNGPAPTQGYTIGPAANVFSPTLPTTGIGATSPQQSEFQQSTFPGAFRPSRQYLQNFNLETTTLDAIEPPTFSPETHTTSRTPSLCDDTQGPYAPLSPTTIKRESPAGSPRSPQESDTKANTSASTSTTSLRPARKRGRPRLDQYQTANTTPESSSSAAKHPKTSPYQASTRLPHNQVERKYREGLNAELERLRRAVPTLPQSDEQGQPKPSKAMVLAGAIEYIRVVERERDEARAELARLKARGSRGGSEMGTGQDALDEFLRRV